MTDAADDFPVLRGIFCSANQAHGIDFLFTRKAFWGVVLSEENRHFARLFQHPLTLAAQCCARYFFCMDLGQFASLLAFNEP
jgi:hypothetical protein